MNFEQEENKQFYANTSSFDQEVINSLIRQIYDVFLPDTKELHAELWSYNGNIIFSEYRSSTKAYQSSPLINLGVQEWHAQWEHISDKDLEDDAFELQIDLLELSIFKQVSEALKDMCATSNLKVHWYSEQGNVIHF